MNDLVLKGLLFFLASTLQLKIVESAELMTASEKPKGCVYGPSWPCIVSSGDKPRFIQNDSTLQWELDKGSLLKFKSKNSARLLQGQVVVKAANAFVVQTLFGKVKLKNSKVLLNLNQERLEVSVISGEPVSVVLRGESSPQVLLAGFQNYYTGPTAGVFRYEVPKVIDLHQYSILRAPFFMDYKLGFQKELSTLAGHIKWAAKISSQLHRDLVERKMASVDEKQKLKKQRSHQQRQYDQNLRQLFLKKIMYDD